MYQFGAYLSYSEFRISFDVREICYWFVTPATYKQFVWSAAYSRHLRPYGIARHSATPYPLQKFISFEDIDKNEWIMNRAWNEAKTEEIIRVRVLCYSPEILEDVGILIWNWPQTELCYEYFDWILKRNAINIFIASKLWYEQKV